MQCLALEAKMVHKDEELRKRSLEMIHGLLQLKGSLSSDVYARIARATQALRPVIEIALTSYTISDEIREFLREFNVVDESLLEEAEDPGNQTDDYQSDIQRHSGSDSDDEEPGKSHVKMIHGILTIKF